MTDRGDRSPTGGDRGADQARRAPDRDARTGRSAAAARMQHQARWVDLQLEQAVERGDFDDLPGYGKPLRGLGGDHDPDWWLKQLVEREQVSVLPPALAIRREDAELDDVLDELTAERAVRREVEEFNGRVRAALYQPRGGPPMVTRQRDPDDEVRRWEERRRERHAAPRDDPAPQGDQGRSAGRRRHWWHLRG
jgi:hypothetical protein